MEMMGLLAAVLIFSSLVMSVHCCRVVDCDEEGMLMAAGHEGIACWCQGQAASADDKRQKTEDR